MTKEKIASSYMEQQKTKTTFTPPLQAKVLITGVSRGNIGEAIALKFDCKKYIPDEKDLDVTCRDSIYNYMFDKEDLTHLICCHGFTHLDWFENQSELNIDKAININLTGTINIVQSFVQKTLGKPYQKRIIIIGSMAYNHVLNASAPYCAAKAGVNHFAECIAWELAPKGYDVYVVNPSNTENTPMTEKTIEGIMRYRGIGREEAEAYWGAVLPKDRWLQKDDIAEIVHHLCHEKSGYMSGAHIDLKGGQR